ncbi:remorin-like [Impatiens glandulifera]|uniref:remorin-like n=1 Tax=Impatiens glandulifera TaxID=253017 RepID=UPI001FB1449D|nr:remorin-like [Impatiens glandulifera]
MGEELEQKKVLVEPPPTTQAGHETSKEDAAAAVNEEKTILTIVDSSKSDHLQKIVDDAAVTGDERKTQGSIGRDAELARVANEKRQSLIKAWEESEKSKAENKAQKKLSAISAWENTRKATVEADLKKIEEEMEKKKADNIEKMKNKIAMIHKEAEEKRALIEAKRAGDFLKAEELSAKYRATGGPPKKLIGCLP